MKGGRSLQAKFTDGKNQSFPSNVSRHGQAASMVLIRYWLVVLELRATPPGASRIAKPIIKDSLILLPSPPTSIHNSTCILTNKVSHEGFNHFKRFIR